MTEQSQNSGVTAEEKRTASDRRTHKHDELYNYAVVSGYFVDLRKGERRQNAERVEVKL